MISIWHWHTEPALLGGGLLVVWLYGMLVGPLRGWVDPKEAFPKKAVLWFGLAAIIFYLAVGSPLDAMGENFLFSAHMFQHNILMYIVPIFAIWALPPWLVDGLLERSSLLMKMVQFFTHPLTAGLLFTVVFCTWHFPLLYEWALRDRTVHILEHLGMFGTSFLMLWPVLFESKYSKRMPWGMQMLYIFVLMVAQIPLFAFLAFAGHALYPTYEYAPRLILELGPLEDQILGALFMKVANMILSLVLIGRAFYQWNQEGEKVSK